MNSSVKQPPVKKNKPPPQVRQTLTSKLRLLKANPLLMFQLQEEFNAKKPNEEQSLFVPLKTLVEEVLDNKEPAKAIVKPSHIATKKTAIDNLKKTNFSAKEKKCLQKPTHKTLSRKTEFVIPKKNVKEHKTESHVLQVKKPKVVSQETKIPAINIISTVTSPRKSVHFNNGIKNAILTPSTPDRTSKEMTKRLSEWMKTRGKNLADYHHLKCFGIHLQKKQPLDAQNDKENIATIVLNKSFDSEAQNDKENIETVILNNSFDNEADTEVKQIHNETFNFSTVAHDALLDLHKLILEGYPPEQCETWLKLIKEKCKRLEEEPEYWECRAALEQTKGNINMAVECYKTAIIHGAEVQNVDKHLDQLLQKFNLLNIDNDQEGGRNEKSHLVKDVANIFKSSIIQFAVQERFIRTKNDDGVTLQKKLIATPVRRSTRRSRSAFISTPKVQIYSSLQDIDSSIRSTVDFQCNNALRD